MYDTMLSTSNIFFSYSTLPAVTIEQVHLNCIFLNFFYICNEDIAFFPLSVYCKFFCDLPGLCCSTSVSSFVLQLQF